MSSFAIDADVIAPCTPAELFPFVDDLAAYPPWMRLVHAVTAVEPDEQGRPAWQVELRARVGPLARSKRLRMVRTVHQTDTEVVFERMEVDGRAHSAWVLTATLTGLDAGTRLDVRLNYGGGLWTGGVLERVLRDEIDRGRRRLLELVAAR
jgi:hypothetical protein